MSAYIMQEDIVQPRLTVGEAMMFAARLKLGPEIKESEKILVVEEVIQLLGLEKCMKTRSEYLSGGQRKRLAVALELVNNPPVIFLDEPTTGLDNVAIKQCIELLHKITKLGRTVICTIHQPSASLFQNFDQVYILAQGYCVYNGSPSHLVPFLSKANYPCPETYTPADFVIEVIQSNSEAINQLSGLIQNGRTNLLETSKEETLNWNNGVDILEIYQDATQIDTSDHNEVFPVSIWGQLFILLHRIFLQTSRNRTALYIQLVHHIASGGLVGGSFVGLGNDASQVLALFKYILAVNVFFMYTHVMVPVLIFPIELELMKREYFNRWYSLKAYYLAFSIAALPLTIIFGIMFVIIVYLLSNQPLDIETFLWFTGTCLAIALCSQGLGYLIGSIFSITGGSVAGPSILAPLLALALYGMGYRTTGEYFMKILMNLSFMKFGVVGIATALFANREPLECNELYCHYKHPQLFLRDLNMEGQSGAIQVYAILGYSVLFRVLSFCVLKYKFTSELRNKMVNLAKKIARQKE